MGDKSKILIFFIILIFLGTTLAVVSLLTSVPNSNDNKDDGENSDDKDDDGNVIIIGDDEKDKYKYAAITNEDSLVLYKADGTVLRVNLEKRNWQNLQISPDGKVLSVLGNRNADVKDLGLYTIGTERFGWYTDYTGQLTGILQYLWKDNQTLIFHQGADNEEWFHSFYYPTQVEIQKVFRSRGDFINLNLAKDRILYLFTNGYRVYDLAGTEIWDVEGIEDTEGNTLDADQMMFMKDDNKLVFEFEDRLYKINVGETVAKQIEVDTDVLTLGCAFDEDNLVTYENPALGIQKINYINVKEDTIVEEVILDDLENQQILPFQVFCYEDNTVMFGTGEGLDTHWYELTDGEIKKIEFLDGAEEVRRISSDEV